jgi:hypothetical protein
MAEISKLKRIKFDSSFSSCRIRPDWPADTMSVILQSAASQDILEFQGVAVATPELQNAVRRSSAQDAG